MDAETTTGGMRQTLWRGKHGVIVSDQDGVYYIPAAAADGRWLLLDGTWLDRSDIEGLDLGAAIREGRVKVETKPGQSQFVPLEA